MGHGKRVAVIYLTHGEAGHNNMRAERAAGLGAVRGVVSAIEEPHVLDPDGTQRMAQFQLGNRQ